MQLAVVLVHSRAIQSCLESNLSYFVQSDDEIRSDYSRNSSVKSATTTVQQVELQCGKKWVPFHDSGGASRRAQLTLSPLTTPVQYRLSDLVRLHVPLGASAVVFAVPCPLEGHRPDVSVKPGGIMRMDTSLCSPRRFHMLLPFDQVSVRVLAVLQGLIGSIFRTTYLATLFLEP